MAGRGLTAAVTAAPSIELREITKRFDAVTALDGVSLRVERGEFLTLLGPSGCGKTTTLRTIGGFELPTRGEVYLDGAAMGATPPHRRPVNTVFQHYALFPHLSVGQNVAYGLEMAGVPKRERDRRVGEILELVRLPGVERRKPAELSGGQQQRVALARALVTQPAVLLLDEPLGALDLKLRQAMQGELKRLHREVGATFVYVTHDQEEALTMSDRIAVMNAGRVLQLGEPDEIYERPRTRFVADFVGQTNFLDARVLSLDGTEAEVEVAGSGRLRTRVPAGSAPTGRVMLSVRPEKLTLAADAPAEPATGWNRLEGTLVGAVYVGTHTQHVVALPGGATVTVHRQNRAAGAPGPIAGEAVSLVFDREAATILAE
ncbi:MAG: Spermidine/putrescine import ABC transporter ATP-binding protein PotA [uncultured Thermomicrobiales bacterium]|uniref:Spermidine/putrescine import ATP-binding protein PotA n=1 Tax=uncultured Thermomicrobiales bacterium TaxID=1645740 RepID=A0A6J4VKD0_9BACT|nr:MAG: Spermidine/putrescine import ABC transporter ATP-binding protein PotA [uncultured Thermomicrobiales bacterium]